MIRRQPVHVLTVTIGASVHHVIASWSCSCGAGREGLRSFELAEVGAERHSVRFASKGKAA